MNNVIFHEVDEFSTFTWRRERRKKEWSYQMEVIPVVKHQRKTIISVNNQILIEFW